jgi:hypothetical protein
VITGAQKLLRVSPPLSAISETAKWNQFRGVTTIAALEVAFIRADDILRTSTTDDAIGTSHALRRVHPQLCRRDVRQAGCEMEASISFVVFLWLSASALASAGSSMDTPTPYYIEFHWSLRTKHCGKVSQAVAAVLVLEVMYFIGRGGSCRGCNDRCCLDRSQWSWLQRTRLQRTRLQRSRLKGSRLQRSRLQWSMLQRSSWPRYFSLFEAVKVAAVRVEFISFIGRCCSGYC